MTVSKQAAAEGMQKVSLPLCKLRRHTILTDCCGRCCNMHHCVSTLHHHSVWELRCHSVVLFGSRVTVVVYKGCCWHVTGFAGRICLFDLVLLASLSPSLAGCQAQLLSRVCSPMRCIHPSNCKLYSCTTFAGQKDQLSALLSGWTCVVWLVGTGCQKQHIL